MFAMRPAFFVLAALLAIVAPGCGTDDGEEAPTPTDETSTQTGNTDSSDNDGNDDQTDDTTSTAPVPETTFTSIQSTLFATKCGGCHGSSGGLTFSGTGAYADLVSAPEKNSPLCDSELRVNPGDPDNSVLIKRLEGTACGPRMPKGGTPLTTEQIAAIRNWILAGAADN